MIKEWRRNDKAKSEEERRKESTEERLGRARERKGKMGKDQRKERK